MGFGVNDQSNPFKSLGLQGGNSSDGKNSGHVNSSVFGSKVSSIKEKEKESVSAVAPPTPQGVSVFNSMSPAIMAVTPVASVEQVLGVRVGQDNGLSGMVGYAKNSVGNYLGSTQGKRPDLGQRPSATLGFDKDGNPVHRVTDRSTGHVAENKEFVSPEGIFTQEMTLSNKNGQVISQGIKTTQADGSSSVQALVNKENGSSIATSANYDASGKFVDGTRTITARDRSQETMTQKRNEDGTYTATTTDKNGSVSVSKFDKDGNPFANSLQKTAHVGGSLGDIKSQKADVLAQKRTEVADALSAGKGPVAQKYQQLDEKSAKIDAKISTLDSTQNQEKLSSLGEMQNNIKEKQSSIVDKFANKALAKDEKFTQLSAQENHEQQMVDKYYAFDLKDKNGTKLGAEEISNRKSDLFDGSGKRLDRATLASKGVEMTYSQEAILAMPLAVLMNPEASMGERNAALIAFAGDKSVQTTDGAPQPSGDSIVNGFASSSGDSISVAMGAGAPSSSGSSSSGSSSGGGGSSIG